jgi:hypothetical protein
LRRSRPSWPEFQPATDSADLRGDILTPEVDILNKTAFALVIKFLLTFAMAAAAFFGMERNAWSYIAWVALGSTIANYVIGDLFILPGLGNSFAAMSDGAMASLLAWEVSFFFPAFRTSFASLAMFAFLIAISEFFFHIYLLREEQVAP